MKTANIIGLSLGAGIGMLLGRYAVHPAWQNSQTDITKANSTIMPWLFLVGSGVLGAGIGYLVAKRVTQDARETKPSKPRQRAVTQYYPALDDGPIPVIVVQHEAGDEDYDGNYTLIFPTEAADYAGRTATSYDSLSGHGAASKGYATGKKRASAYKAKELLSKYCAGHDCSSSDYKIVSKWDASYDSKRRSSARSLSDRASVSDPDCKPRRRYKRTRKTVARERMKVGNKTVTVSVTRPITRD